MKILITGGYGNISWWCTKRALELGHDVYILNREQTRLTRREIPKEAFVINADYKDFYSVKECISKYSFDVVCDFLCQGKEDAQRTYELFKNKTKQYILISSESVYKRVPDDEPMSENAQKYELSEVSPYILGKLESEQFLTDKCNSEKFPLIIVRPGYTLDTILPYSIGQNCYTVANRYLNGKPILIAGNGENLWTFTHSSDFANAFVCLFGGRDLSGESFNIMGDTVVSFNKMMKVLAKELRNTEPYFLHIPYQDALHLSQFMPNDLMKQRMQNAIFDTSKIKSLVPDWKTNKNEEDIVRIAIKWLNEDVRRIRINQELDNKLEDLTKKYRDTL